jgi:hypothetical protein
LPLLLPLANHPTLQEAFTQLSTLLALAAHDTFAAHVPDVAATPLVTIAAFEAT